MHIVVINLKKWTMASLERSSGARSYMGVKKNKKQKRQYTCSAMLERGSLLTDRRQSSREAPNAVLITISVVLE